MIDYDDYFGDLTEEEYVRQTEEHFKWLEENTTDDIQKFLEAVEQFCEHIYEATEIFLANPMDLIKIDMSEIPLNYYFISDYHIDKGIMYKIKDGELKRALYEFIEKYPDRVFRGKK